MHEFPLGIIAFGTLESMPNPWSQRRSSPNPQPYENLLEDLQKVSRIPLISTPSKCFIFIAFIKGFEGAARKYMDS